MVRAVASSLFLFIFFSAFTSFAEDSARSEYGDYPYNQGLTGNLAGQVVFYGTSASKDSCVSSETTKFPFYCQRACELACQFRGGVRSSKVIGKVKQIVGPHFSGYRYGIPQYVCSLHYTSPFCSCECADGAENDVGRETTDSVDTERATTMEPEYYLDQLFE